GGACTWRAAGAAGRPGAGRGGGGRRAPPQRPAPPPPRDVLFVPGGGGPRRGASDTLIGWVRKTAADASWVTSVCTGAFVLHEAGLAQGRRVATHHAYEDDLAARGGVTVVRDARYVVDGNLVTSQGVSAGIDMALWLVGHIHRRPHARAVPRYIQYHPGPPHLAGGPPTWPQAAAAHSPMST